MIARLLAYAVEAAALLAAVVVVGLAFGRAVDFVVAHDLRWVVAVPVLAVMALVAIAGRRRV